MCCNNMWFYIDMSHCEWAMCGYEGFLVLSGIVNIFFAYIISTFWWLKLKKISLRAWTGHEGSRRFKAPRFQDSPHMKVLKSSALGIGRLYPPGNIPGTHFLKRLSRPQDHSVAGRIMSMKNSSDNIRNRTRDLPACSTISHNFACA